MTKIITIKYGELTLELEGQYIDTSFQHEFGTHKQGHYECEHVRHQGYELPMDMFNIDTLEHFDNELDNS